MSEWLFIVAFVLFWLGLKKRWLRAEERENELDQLETQRQEDRLWGESAKDADRALRDKRTEHRKTDFVFELTCWGLFVASAAFVVAGVLLWLAEDPTHTWEKALGTGSQVLMLVAGGAYALWLIYRLTRRLDKAENEIRWLTRTLARVRSHAEEMRRASIDSYVELRDRLDQPPGTLRP